MDSKPKFTDSKYLVVFAFVTSLFMLWGIAITMGETLNKHFQDVLDLTKAESALVQFSIFGAYFIMGIPAGLFMKRFGYKNGVLFGLLLYACGAFLFVPAANAESFTFFRVALFILACGLATLETVAHPFLASLGDQRTSDQRLNFAQGFNGAGAIIGPLLGGFFILRVGSGTVGDDLDSVKSLYIGIGIMITAVAVAFSFVKVPQLKDPHVVDVNAMATGGELHAPKKLFQHKHFVWAVVAQFFNVAAQGGTWSFFINYGHDQMGFTAERASYIFGFSMGLMMIGRFASTYIMRFVAPHKLLAYYTLANAILCVIIAQSFGTVSFAALIMLSFFMSIMFPTIFSLGLKDLGKHTQQASSFIVMGVVGGALFPWVMGKVADMTDIATAYYMPIICYAFIFYFGYRFLHLKGDAKA